MAYQKSPPPPPSSFLPPIIWDHQKAFCGHFPFIFPPKIPSGPLSEQKSQNQVLCLFPNSFHLAWSRWWTRALREADSNYKQVSWWKGNSSHGKSCRCVGELHYSYQVKAIDAIPHASILTHAQYHEHVSLKLSQGLPSSCILQY